MAKQIINIGQSANDKSGDPLRTAFEKVNANFTELYATTGADAPANQLVNGIHTVTLGADGVLSAGSITFGGTLKTGSQSQYQFEELVTGEGEGTVYYSKLTLPNIPEIFGGESLSLVTWGSELAIKVRNPSDFFNDYTWSFGNDGALTLPNTATILSGNPDSFAIYANPNAETVIGMTSQQGNEYVTLGTSAGLWQFDARGTLSTPLLLPKTFTAVLDPAHYSGEGTLVLEGEAWSCGVQFQVNPDGSVQTVIDNPVRGTNPGYSNGLTFNFVEADHGIPGYTFTITLSDIQHPIPEVWTVNIAVSQPPAYPATVKSLGAVKLTADTQSWVFGTDGDFTAPGDITASFFMGQTLDITGAGAVSSTYAGDLNTLHVTGNVGNGLTLGTNGGLTSWLFKPDGSITLPAGGDIVDSTGASVLGTPTVIDGGNASTTF